MNYELTTQLRRAQLYIANEIKRICEKEKIHFFLDCGSMLGAVRHHGYIPWDDDMDIGMLMPDYEKFIKIAPEELGEDFYLDEYRTNRECAYVYAKVRLKGTKYIEEKGSKTDKHNEIFVDIFPYFYVPENKKQWEKDAFFLAFFGWAISCKAGSRIWHGNGIKKSLLFIPARIVGSACSFEFLRRKVDYFITKTVKSKYVCICDGWLKSYRRSIIPLKLLNEYIDADFEGCCFPIPKEYHSYLSIVYGDYMTLPPKDEQRTHMIQEIDFGKHHFAN